VPVAIIQGANDQYGTVLQIEVAQEECYCPVDVTLISGAGHSLHREVPNETLAALGAFTDRILRVHESADRAA
jgi:pimeloyl-ACP methyl ester carboxylesterase